MHVISLTSDLGYKDHYLGTLKALILNRAEQYVQFIEVNNRIPSYDIVRAAYAVKNTYTSFPVPSIHLVLISNYYNSKPSLLVFKKEGHFFIIPDNGLLNLIFPDFKSSVRRVDIEVYNGPNSVYEAYAQICAYIIQGGSLGKLGKRTQSYAKGLGLMPVIENKRLRATVIHVDIYGNVVINVDRELFEKIVGNEDFSIYYKQRDPIKNMSKSYASVDVGEVLAWFNSSDLLEIAVNMGDASTLLGLKRDDLIQIEF